MAQMVDEAGNVWEVDASGNPVRYVGKIGKQGVPSNPIKVREAVTGIDKTRADTARTTVQTQGDTIKNVTDAATQQAVIAKAAADAMKAQKDAQQADAQRAAALQQFNGARMLELQAANLRDKFDQGPGATKGFMGLTDYLPTQRNTAFDQAAGVARGPIVKALGLIGSQANTGTEAQMWTGPYIPSSWTYDDNIINSLDYLKQQSDSAYREAVQKLGGIPDQNGVVHPFDSPEGQKLIADYGINPQVFGITKRNDTPPPLIGAAGGGNTPNTGPTGPGAGSPNGPAAPVDMQLSRGASFTTPQDLAVAAAVTKAFQAGGDVNALVQAAQSAGGQITPQDLANFQQAIQARKTGRAVQFTPQATGQRTPMQQKIGSALMSPVGTAAASAISGAGLNVMDALAPDQMKALRALNPTAATMGDIGGAIAGTGVLNAGARAGLKALPGVGQRVLGGGGLAKFGRGVLGDTAYGAAYGENVNGDATAGALGGALGSVGGQVVGRGIGKAIGGVAQSEAGQALSQQIKDLTIGQRMGGAVKSFEDALTSIPGVGDLVNLRRAESIRGLNQAAFRQASGGAVDQIGREGLDQFGNATEGAYRTALDGKQFPLDAQFTPEYQQALAARGRLMPDYQAKLDTAVNNRVAPIVNNGVITGNEYQQAMRGLRNYKGARGADGFEQDYSDAISGIQDTLRQNVLRSASPETVAQLGQADRLYRGQKIIEDAIARNRKDAAGIGSDLFRPGDLTEAVYQNSKKYGGNAPLNDLARYAQEVIPSKVPDSGTAKRLLAANLAGAGLGAGLGGGGGALMSDDAMSGAGTGATAGTAGALGVLGLLALGGTKAGQAAIAKALFNRPDSLTRFGAAVSKRKGLFGSAAVPLLLEGQNQ